MSYYDVKKNYQFTFNANHTRKKSNELNTHPHPGQIDNNRLLVNLNDFYHDGNPENPENIVIRNDIYQKTDYRLVNEEIWNFFQQYIYNILY